MTLTEIYQLYHISDAPQQDLFNKIIAAVIKAAEVVRTEAPATSNHANRLLWSKRAFENPREEANRMWPAILAANSGATLAQAVSASDTAIQNAVNAAIDLFATGS